MKKKKLNETVKKIIVIIVAVGIGTFICRVLENTEINVWLARGTGALVTVVSGLLCHYFLQRVRYKKGDKSYE